MKQDSVGIKTPEYVSLQFQLAGLGSRAAAFIIDQLILTVVNILFIILLFLILIGKPSMNNFLFFDMDSVMIAVAIIVIFLLNWGYFFAFEYFSGGKTIGKKIIGIRVIQENGHSITLLSSFIRNLLRIIDSLPVNYFLGIIMIFFHPKHKRLGDLVAGTIVVHERKIKKERSPLEKEMEKRGLAKDDLVIDDSMLKSFGTKEWKLLQLYCSRFLQLPLHERRELTNEVAAIVCAKINLDFQGKSEKELEDMLLVLYLIVREDFEI